MKPKLYSFLSGVLVTLILIALPVSALASDGSFKLTAYPIQVLVNGQVFRPVDAKGNEIMVFTVNGTTYAPLRALAEAYGLEVGYEISLPSQSPQRLLRRFLILLRPGRSKRSR